MAAGTFRLSKSAVSDAVTLTLPQGLGLMLAAGSIQLRVAPMSLTLLAPSPEPAISASPSLTREQKRQIRETFAVIEPASDLVARLFFRGIYFPQMNKRAWIKLLMQNRRTIFSLTKEGVSTWRASKRKPSGGIAEVNAINAEN